MKQLTITTLLSVLSLVAFSQNKFKAGIYTEGAWFFPDGAITLENGFVLGGGLYASYSIGKMFSTSLGAGYCFKTNKQERNEPVDTGYKIVTDKFPQHYFVIPLKIQFSPIPKFFLETGIESAWLLNYDVVFEKPEHNWLLGAGYQFSPKLKSSLSYRQGFKDQGFGGHREGEGYIQEVYKNRMLVLNVSYAIFD